MKEIWKIIPKFEGIFYASNLGRIKRKERKWYSGRNNSQLKIMPESIAKQRTLVNGYKKCNICINGIKKSYSIHRLVAEAFIPNPDNLPCINHKDGNKGNNKVDNLEWCTYSQNAVHSVYVLHKSYGYNNSRTILSKKEVSFIRKKYKKRDKNFGRKALSKRFGISESAMTNYLYNKNYD